VSQPEPATEFPFGANAEQTRLDDMAKEFSQWLDQAKSKEAVDVIVGQIVAKKDVLGEKRLKGLRAQVAAVQSQFVAPAGPPVNVAKVAKEVLGAVPVSEGGPPFLPQ
jgi:hypothetical protein